MSHRWEIATTTTLLCPVLRGTFSVLFRFRVELTFLFSSTFQFLGIMVATMVVCSAILYFAASINVFKVYLHIMKEYGWPFGK